ncbi:MAG TPA: Fe-S cluster assembly protein SufD [Bryobacteraceae bacterium]|nr:Fe-S cluster assembly protein SufD [Bryobacteraceae bacterium]
MTAVSEQVGAWLAPFTAQPPAAGWIQELREAGFRRFAEMGFPTTHDEDWRFTNVAPIARSKFRVRAADVLRTLPEGVEQLGLDEVRDHLGHCAGFDQNAFVALNTAFLNDQGLATVLRVPRGAVLESPIEITCEVNGGESGVAVNPRTLILVGANAQCSIVETHKGSGRYFTNAVTEIVAGDGAIVDHYKVTLEAPGAYHVGSTEARLGRSANYTTHSISLGGALVRHNVGAVLSEGTEATLNGLYIVNGTQHVDSHTTIDHAKPHGTSHELYKGILDGKASAVFNGRILVRKDAQKTDSKQTNKNLVLSEEAVIDTKPELQILADDVRCTHGATIGQLDAESLFYLQSRGIGKSEARRLLTYAFAQDIVDRIKVPELKDSLERMLVEKFHEHAQ